MNKDLILKRTKNFVKEELGNESSGHDYWHVIRVYKLAKTIAEKEDANKFIVQIASLLHDIGDQGSAELHAQSCADAAEEFLRQFNLDAETLDHIKSCILTHPARLSRNAETLEARIVADSDAMDAIGAVGIVRTAQYYSSKQMSVHDPSVPPKSKFDGKSETMVNHFYEKLLVLSEGMFTDTAKQMAEKRIQFMREFLNQFLSEWDGRL